jgi:FlaA1/EpsC-like NDP-sugar epimerase
MRHHFQAFQDQTMKRGEIRSVVALLRRIANLPRPVRGSIALGIDLVACIACVWLAFSIRLGVWQLASPPVGLVIVIAIPSWLFAARWFGIYRSIIRTSGTRALLDLAMACMLYSIPMIVTFMFVGLAGVPRTVGVLQPLLFLLSLAINRIMIRYVLIDILHKSAGGSDRRVAIYGAGIAGQQLGYALRQEGALNLVAYIDDNGSLVGHRMDGISIYSGREIDEIVDGLRINEILLALPGISRARRLEIIERLAPLAVSVRSLPSITNLIDGRVSVSDLREIQLDELLGRDPVPPDEELLSGAITYKDVLVSGAGGSIGSELCRQIILRRPRKIVLVDQSEYALYSVLSEIEQCVEAGSVEIVPELLDVSDAHAVARMMERYQPHTVFHAAAYKHVPLVEANPISGLRNNVFGTLHCCLEAERVKVSRFILVSTDKAVRPTNIMGASKRICELILQARAASGTDTIFSMVRFGNVLGSSGSVVPRFKAQIAAGGPITLTHRNITRFFMTIPEAAQLVMQAGALARGGEVFVLDMGEPVRIYDLACTMIQLSGCTLRTPENPDGDIAIAEIGLRPGEKMFEELLLGDNPQPTRHDRILQAQEHSLTWEMLSQLLDTLSRALDAGDLEATLEVVRRCVPGYSPAGQDRVAPALVGRA